MGDIRIDGSQNTRDGGWNRSRMQGTLTHHGPYSVLQVSGGGQGWVYWYARQGAGQYQLGERHFDLKIKYMGLGHYTYEVSSSEGVRCRGRFCEDAQPQVESTVPPLPELPAELGAVPTPDAPAVPAGLPRAPSPSLF